MPVPVVHQLELVEVDQRDGERDPRPIREGEGTFRGGRQALAVEQPGEGIGVRLMTEARALPADRLGRHHDRGGHEDPGVRGHVMRVGDERAQEGDRDQSRMRASGGAREEEGGIDAHPHVVAGGDDHPHAGGRAGDQHGDQRRSADHREMEEPARHSTAEPPEGERGAERDGAGQPEQLNGGSRARRKRGREEPAQSSGERNQRERAHGGRQPGAIPEGIEPSP